MSNITVVTTFHQPGLELYGQRFLDSFAEHVDKKIKLIVYAEECNPLNPDPTQIKVIDSVSGLPKLTAFKERWKNDPKANGIPPEEIKRRRKDWNKAFKWDAIRFSNKVYAVFEACAQRPSNWVVWMDADTYVHSDWSYDDYKKLLPDDKYITYVGRGKGSQTWPECGFYGMNLNHPVCHSFLEDFERMYEDADNGIFTLDEWHDSYVFGEILKKYKEFNAEHDYSAEMYLREAKSGGGGHPLINTELGRWIDHMKGDRKVQGKSKRSDIMVRRLEDYWK